MAKRGLLGEGGLGALEVLVCWTSIRLLLMVVSVPLHLFCKEMYVEGMKALAKGF